MSRQRLHAGAMLLFALLLPVGEGAAFAALGLWGAITLWRWKELRPGLLVSGHARPVFAGLAGFFALGLVAWGMGGEGALEPGELGLWAPYLIVPLALLSDNILPRRALENAVTAFVVMLTVAGIYGIVQSALDTRVGESLLRGAFDGAYQSSIPDSPGGVVAGGFFFHRLKMAHVLLPGIALLVARQLFAHFGRARRAVEAVALAIAGLTLLLTYTRAALLAVAMAALCLLPFCRRRVWFSAAAGLVVLGVVALTIPSVRARVQSIGGSEAPTIRAFIWAQGTRVIADHPLGAGLGNYPTVVSRHYELVDPNFHVRTYPHSVALAAFAEAGPLGMLLYLWAWVALVLACIRTLREHTATEARRLAAATGLCGALAFWIVGLSHDVLFHRPVALTFAAMIGAVLACLDNPGSEASQAESSS